MKLTHAYEIYTSLDFKCIHEYNYYGQIGIETEKIYYWCEKYCKKRELYLHIRIEKKKE